MMCWTVKYLDGRTITRALCDYKGYKPFFKDDSKLVKELHDIFETTDVLVAHNGDRFDIKESNKRFIFHGLTPPSPYKTVDTLKVAKRHFSFISNKLNDLGEFLGVGQKVKHPGFDMWLGCYAGDPKSWALMKKYNRQDVYPLLEGVYLKLLPWITNHPPLSTDCANCGNSTILTTRSYMTKRGPKTRGQCECGSWREITNGHTKS